MLTKKPSVGSMGRFWNCTLIFLCFFFFFKERINEMENLADASKSYNMTIWFGHHPFSVTTTPSVRKILRQVKDQ